MGAYIGLKKRDTWFLILIRKTNKHINYQTRAYKHLIATQRKISHKFTGLWIIFQPEEDKSFDSVALYWSLRSLCLQQASNWQGCCWFQVQTEDVICVCVCVGGFMGWMSWENLGTFSPRQNTLYWHSSGVTESLRGRVMGQQSSFVMMITSQAQDWEVIMY